MCRRKEDTRWSDVSLPEEDLFLEQSWDLCFFSLSEHNFFVVRKCLSVIFTEDFGNRNFLLCITSLLYLFSCGRATQRSSLQFSCDYLLQVIAIVNSHAVKSSESEYGIRHISDFPEYLLPIILIRNPYHIQSCRSLGQKKGISAHRLPLCIPGWSIAVIGRGATSTQTVSH